MENLGGVNACDDEKRQISKASDAAALRVGVGAAIVECACVGVGVGAGVAREEREVGFLDLRVTNIK